MHHPQPVQFVSTWSCVGVSSKALGGQTPVHSPQRTQVSESTRMLADAVTIQAWAGSAAAGWLWRARPSAVNPVSAHLTRTGDNGIATS